VKVYMAPCGVGLGHITRCEPIARELSKHRVEVVFSTYGDGIGYAERMKLKTVRTVPIYIRVRRDGSVDFKQTATRSGLSLGVRTFIRQVLAEIRNLKAFKPNLVFSDSRASTLIAARLLRIPTILMLNQYKVNIIRKPSARRISLGDRAFFFIANTSWVFFRTLLQGVWSLSDQVLIPDFPPPYTVSLGNLAIPERYRRKVKLVGPVVTASPSKISHSATEIREKHGLDSVKPLVYIAISGPKVERRFLAHLMEGEIRKEAYNCLFVMSRGEASGTEDPTKHGELVTFDWLEEEFQYEILKACNLVVSRAGHGMIMKAMTFGKPMILVPIPDHTEQYGNAERVERLGLAKILDQSEVKSNKLRTTINDVLASKDASAIGHEISLFAEQLNTVNEVSGLILSRIGSLEGSPRWTTQPEGARLSVDLPRPTSTMKLCPKITPVHAEGPTTSL
jgi:UDP-N-acetylglucosamine--N-acetylmuramyl-(pentapeptide) pyrophosphoryl-undecaprenol N-acetylglucosamine transferase